MQRENEEQQQEKKPYQKPEIRRFPLRPEEAVLGACKSSAGGGPSPSCNTAFCKTKGS